MSFDSLPLANLIGQSFVDREGQRWWVRGRRPSSQDQFVIEAEVKASYRRVDLYVMTEREFHARARNEQLRRDAPAREGAR